MLNNKKIIADQVSGFWREYTGKEINDDFALEIYGNTLAFVQQVVRMKQLIDAKEKEEKL